MDNLKNINISTKLVYTFLKNHKLVTGLLLILILIINLLKTNIISYLSASIIRSIQSENKIEAYKFYYIFIIVSLLYIILIVIYRFGYAYYAIKMRNWTRYELVNNLLNINNEFYSDINFTNLQSPISRLSNTITYIFNASVNTIIPSISQFFIISIYFSYKNLMLGFIFILGNIILIIYIIFNFNSIKTKGINYELGVEKIETNMVELLGNMDKIIFRGKKNEHIEDFKNNSNKLINKGLKFYSTTMYHELIINLILFLNIFISIFYLIYLYFNNKINSITFVTFITILLLYRDYIINALKEMSSSIEMIGRFISIGTYFKNMNIDQYFENKDKKNIVNKILNFDKIKFENINFKYKDSKHVILNNFNLEINMNGIIGITGLSGNGKSTFCKLLIKIYEYDGNIYIDNENIQNINTDYIRNNIIYINQNLKLFDKTLKENMLYGCTNDFKCKKYIKELLEYPKIKQLFKNLEIEYNNVGLMGDKLSGGQKQVINIINGLITPSKIIILDEPTNGLDGDLKVEIINIIRYFKKYKKCIIIISHDKEIYNIFDKVIKI
jgi:ABC-type multidrug transport system fused ATPase/permease subunit